LIITSQFPPSNLTGVHRARLFANHLPEYGWEPIVLTVDEKYYEEKLDPDLSSLLPPGLRIEKVSAFRITKPRTIGDIGLRAFFQLHKKAKQIIRTEKIDFLYIPIPSFYIALLGRWLHRETRIHYGIDYIDPWVQPGSGHKALFSRSSMSNGVARILEPVAVKRASLITGVAEGYYQGVLQRNPGLAKKAVVGAMPYGGEKSDHDKIAAFRSKFSLFEKKAGKLQLIYAGTMLPKAYKPLEEIFKCIAAARASFTNLEIHFVGSGKSPDDALGYNIRPLAERYGLWNNTIFEYPKRIPYLDVLAQLSEADGIFILGSTEIHYTPSKIYQAVLAGKPILAVLNKRSTAVGILKDAGAGIVLEFDGEQTETIQQDWPIVYEEFLQFRKQFTPAQVDQRVFAEFSASETTRKLVQLMEKIK